MNCWFILTQATRLADLGSKFRCRSVDHWPVADEGRFGPGKPFLEVGWRHGAKGERNDIYEITRGSSKRNWQLGDVCSLCLEVEGIYVPRMQEAGSWASCVRGGG